jgi:signal transduction histidine kinase
MISQIYPETTKFTEIISKSVNDILTMINEILNFIKGKTVINIESVDIKKFISQIVKDLNFQIQDKQKNLKLKYSVDFEEDINFDAVQIRRVIYNIAFNAIDLLPENGTLGLKIFKNENFMEMEISNNGPKIPDKIKKNIFEPFFTYKKSEGTGLGLAVAKKIIKDHEGKIFVKSSNDNLTVFSFLIPIR